MSFFVAMSLINRHPLKKFGKITTKKKKLPVSFNACHLFSFLIISCHNPTSLVMALNYCGKGFYGMLPADMESLDDEFYLIFPHGQITQRLKDNKTLKITKLLGVNSFIESFKPGSTAEPGTLTQYENLLLWGLVLLNNLQLEIFDLEDEEEQLEACLMRYNKTITYLVALIEVENGKINIEAPNADVSLDQLRTSLCYVIEEFFQRGIGLNDIYTIVGIYNHKRQTPLRVISDSNYQ